MPPAVFLYGIWLSANDKAVLYLVEGESPDAVSGQLHRVQHGDLDHSIGLCASRRPVLVTLHLAEQERGRTVRTGLLLTSSTRLVRGL